MTSIISFGILLAFALVAFCVIKWWNVRNVGVTPVHLFTFIAILFTSGLDVGLIMFPAGLGFPALCGHRRGTGLWLHQPAGAGVRLLGFPDLGLLFPDDLLFLRDRAAGEVL